ncbi:MAG TPA: hypothetical protein VHZ29_19190 [Rhizomicrobium sp.]|jgi:hypothetical protein|nr:hypothetical protein [Rhizomicrobium sp.]
MNRAYAITLVVAILSGLTGCAGAPEIDDRPRTTADQFRGDFAECKGEAQNIPQQQTQPSTYVATTTFHRNSATTTVGPNPYEAVADVLVDALANSENYAAAVHSCMASKGYIVRPRKVRTFDGGKG